MQEKMIAQSKCGYIAKKILFVSIPVMFLLALQGIVSFFYVLALGAPVAGIAISSLPSLLLLSLLAAINVRLWSATKREIVVTDKRIRLLSFRGKRLDLPLDSISVIRTKIFKGLFIGTPAGFIKVSEVNDCDSVYDAILELIIARQQNKISATKKASLSVDAD